MTSTCSLGANCLISSMTLAAVMWTLYLVAPAPTSSKPGIPGMNAVRFGISRPGLAVEAAGVVLRFGVGVLELPRRAGSGYPPARAPPPNLSLAHGAR